MAGHSLEVAARRAGVSTADVERLAGLGIIGPATNGRYSDADVRRVIVVQTLERAGLPVEGLGELVRGGRFSLRFVDDAGHQVFAALSETTFAELADRTGIPVAMLLVLREVTGGKTATPDDPVREDELEILPLVQYQLELGFQGQAIERALRVYGSSLRRVAEAEAEWWRSEVQEPMLAGDTSPEDLGHRAAEMSPRLSMASDRALMAIYHAQQMHVWSVNIVDGVAAALQEAGLHTVEERLPPAMCFLDLAGFTRLTQERGDAQAAALAEQLNRIVQRISVQHGGRAVKWLGDGVMFHFPDPGSGVIAALEMLSGLRSAGLPRAHVGLHSGPVVLQEGDFYGQTVNLAARIGEYARPGEVLVSRAVRDAAQTRDLAFDEIGPVELKGVPGPIELFSVQQGR
jgi:adenylate cyclase